MHHRLDTIQAIPPATRERLARIGVYCTDDLLIRGRAPDGRDSLARLSGLPPAEIERLVALADLARINGLGPDDAAALVDRAGLRTAGELARRLGEPRGARYTLRYAAQPAVLARAAELAAQLGDGGPPAGRLAEAAEEAFELVPRAVFPAPDDGAAFRQKVLAHYRESKQLPGRSNLVVIGVVLGSALLLFLASHIYVRRELAQLAFDLAQFGPLAAVFNARLERLLWLSETSILLSAAMLLLAGIVTWGVYLLLSRLVNPGLLLLLFNKPAYREPYYRVAMLDLERSRRGTRGGNVILGLLALAVVVTFIVTFFRNPQMTNAEIAGLLAPIVGVGGVLIALTVSAGLMRFYLREFHGGGSADADAGARYTFYMLADAALLPVVILIITRVTLPLAFEVNHSLYRTYIVPRFEVEFAANRQALAALELEDPDLAAFRDTLAPSWEIQEQQAYDTLDLTDSSGDFLEEVLRLTSNLVVWMSLTAVIALFVVPYAALRGWRKSALYGAIIIGAFFLEDWLAAAAPALFFVPGRTVVYWLLVFIVLLASAFFFDFLYDVATRRVRPCPACRLNIDPDTRYCPHCGLAQEGG